MAQIAVSPDELHRLWADQEAVPWTERRELVASLAEALAAVPKSEAALAFVHLLAHDPKPVDGYYSRVQKTGTPQTVLWRSP